MRHSIPCALAALLLAGPAFAFDGDIGGFAGGAPTYYEQVAADPAAAAKAASFAGLPGSLHVVDAAGGTEYRELGRTAEESSWEVVVEIESRPHERVKAVYDLILALALPEGFESEQWRIVARQGTEAASVAVVYGGEKVALKRNVALETLWLPILTGASSGLPDLTGTGYAWTLWDTVLRFDPDAGESLEGFAVFAYTAPPGVAAPAPSDPDNAAFVISWIPTLDPGIPPFTLRLDVVSAAQ